jgi:class 3 adenylate cyclase
MPETRRHAAIMFTDIVGYTRLMGADEEKAVDMLSRNRSIHQSCIEKYNGTII